MNVKQRFSWNARMNSFRYAWGGFIHLWHHEHNSRIHFLLALFAIGLSCMLRIDRMEWLIILGVIFSVFISEIFNTCIEKTMDFISKEQREEIRIIKDISSAAVSLSAMGACLAGCIIFLPKIYVWFTY